ncbi:MAG: cupin domain-containing protein [Geminicoccaceae bacterium]
MRNFPATTLLALVIDLEPGVMRELHWHPDADEWQYYLAGEARMTVFDATSKARTFNYQAGDVGFVPRTMGHYIENIGWTTVRVINVFNSPCYKDMSLRQWMALTPPALMRGHLDLDDVAMAALSRDRRPILRKPVSPRRHDQMIIEARGMKANSWPAPFPAGSRRCRPEHRRHFSEAILARSSRLSWMNLQAVAYSAVMPLSGLPQMWSTSCASLSRNAWS